MKERPILFSAPMVRAILAGTKTQTRRVVKPRPMPAGGWTVAARPRGFEITYWDSDEQERCGIACPYGKPGDRLWVRETFAKIDGQTQPWIETDYRATYTHGDRLGDTLGIKKRWTPAIHMPRAASRITLEVTGVRVERLQAISASDAIAEGIPRGGPENPDGIEQREYRTLWESINGPASWDANPWVWVIEFDRVEALRAAA